MSLQRPPRPFPGGQARRAMRARVSRSGRPTLEALEDRRVLDAGISGQGIPLSALTGLDPGNTEVAAFTGSPAALPAGTYSATIDWGDGTTPTPGQVKTLPVLGPILRGTVPPAPMGVVSVFGDHTYAHPGDFPVKVTLATPVGATAQATTTAHVADLIAEGIAQDASTDYSTAFPILADFRSSDPNAQPGDFTATINWGDGSAPSGAYVTPGASSSDPSRVVFLVGGQHTYTGFATETATVTITDKGGHSTTATSPVLVLPVGATIRSVPIPAAAGTATGPLTVAALSLTASQTVLPHAVSQLSATIDWGDGTSSAGVLQPFPAANPTSPVIGGGDFPAFTNASANVIGDHTYAVAGTYPVRVTVNGAVGLSLVQETPATVTDPGVPPVSTPDPVVPPGAPAGGVVAQAPETTVYGPTPPFRGFGPAAWQALMASSIATVPVIGKPHHPHLPPHTVHHFAPGALAHHFAYHGKHGVSPARHRGH